MSFFIQNTTLYYNSVESVSDPMLVFFLSSFEIKVYAYQQIYLLNGLQNGEVRRDATEMNECPIIIFAQKSEVFAADSIETSVIFIRNGLN